MNQEWKDWIKENIERGCNHDELRVILRQNNFSEEQIAAEFSSHAPAENKGFLSRIRQRFKTAYHEAENRLAQQQPDSSRVSRPDFDYEALSQVAITRNPKAARIEDERLQLYVLDDVLSKNECRQVIERINKRLRPSTISTGKDYSGFRTSSTCDLGLIDDRFIATIDARIADIIGINPDWSETIQGQKYEVGQEFKAHTDYFEPNTTEFEKFAHEQGQRTWTFMIYLNNTPEGGATRFTSIDRAFTPKVGQAVIWNNLHLNGVPNADTIHHGMPVVRGNKYIITKWFRDRGEGAPYANG